MILLSIAAAGIAVCVVIYALIARSPRVFVVVSVLGGLAGMEVMLYNAARQGVSSLFESGSVISVGEVTLIPISAFPLAAAALLGALVAILGVFVVRGVSATKLKRQGAPSV